MMKTAEEIKAFIASKPMNPVARNRVIKDLAEQAWFYWEREKQSGAELGMKPDPEVDRQQAELKKMLRGAGVAKDLQAGTPEGAKADTDYFQKARKELGPGATLSAIAKRAQELKTAGKPAQDRRTRLHRALDCVLNRKAAKDAGETEAAYEKRREAAYNAYKMAKEKYALAQNFGTQAQKESARRRFDAANVKYQSIRRKTADTADFPAEYKDCKRCGKKTDVLEIFPGGVCLGCWEKKEGKAPLTEADFKGMVSAFKNPLKKRAKDSNAEALKKGDKFNYLGTPYIVVSNEGKYTNSQGGTFVDLRVKEIDSITGKGRGERLLSLRA